MSMEIIITEIHLVATRIVLHVGIPRSALEEVEGKLLDSGAAESVSEERDGWNDDEDVVHVAIEIYAFTLQELATSTMFQELAETTLQENNDGVALQITDTEDFGNKILELPSSVLVS